MEMERRPEESSFNSGDTVAGEEFSASGDAGHRAIKKHFLRVSQAISRGHVVETLYAEDLIGEEAMDVFINPSLGATYKGRFIVRQIQASVQANPQSFSTFLDALKQDDGSVELAETLEGQSPS